MAMRIAFQMDAPKGLNPRSDSTLMLIEEAQKRGHHCLCYHPSQLIWESGVLRAPLTPIRVDMQANAWLQLGDTAITPLAEMDIIWMRQDPPYDMHYLTATYLLEQLPVRVLNHPTGVRNAPEKLSPLRFSQFLPPTLITTEDAAIYEFAATHRDVVAKPLYGFGGHSIFRFKQGDGNLEVFLEHSRAQSPIPWMWQAFVPEVAKGERRIILLEGEVAAVFGRQPHEGSIRANMRVGGTPVKAEITPMQAEICATVAPYLREGGLFFVGLDVIGDYLTEINVTSPTGMRAVAALYGKNLAAEIWDRLAA